MENNFLDKVTRIIEENLSDENFGVSELAAETGMSRSNLLRKVQRTSGFSVSQLIRQIRVQKAMEMLKQSDLNVSEVSYRVGFSSTSYFIKCFKDHYGYPPGEVGRGDNSGQQAEGEPRMHPSRQLAAIMFTDIEGYTALMQQDEELAIRFRSRHREVFNSITKKFNGRILQYYGDGTLSTFSSAIDAVRCGIEMQLAFQADPRIPVRIGIHTGDILVSKEEIIGDGVNIASRIESLASPGSVCISEKVYDEIKNQAGIRAVSIGFYELKNVDKPVEVYAITNEGLVIPERGGIRGLEKVKRFDEVNLKSKAEGPRMLVWFVSVALVILAAILYYLFFRPAETGAMNKAAGGKSIAVLPFINDSNDSSNIYIINGLMEAILNNLQKIKDLRVISRTSVEKYRNNPRSIPELSKELNADYFVEGSGQKMGDEILLNIQLIEASTDNQLLSRQYNRKTTEIFSLQMEVARNIAEEIEVIITPEEAARIEKVPTENLEAYDYFLKGQELFNQVNRERLLEAIGYFKQAIDLDENFAEAYADIAIGYYFLDLFQSQKQYTGEIDFYSDKALLLDPQLSQSLTSKALFYLQKRDYGTAVTYLEKALEVNPNSAFVLNTLSDFYTSYVPNTEKYLEYALKGIRINISAHDSVNASFVYLHVSNALIQTGFTEEAEKYIDRSLDYNPDNLFSELIRAYILYARDRDLSETRNRMIKILQKDTTRLDLMQETGKMCYYMKDYDAAFKYYDRFTEIREQQHLDIFRYENAKIGFIMSKMGLNDKAEKYFNDFKDYAEQDNSIYQPVNLATYYAFRNDRDRVFAELTRFSEEEGYFYWIVLFLPIDPLFEDIVEMPEFKRIYKKIDRKFWENHRRIRKSLEEKGLI